MPFVAVCEAVRVFRNSEAAAYQRARWMRPDAFRWLRPDAARWRRPVHPDEAKFNPDQPRVPAGNPDGGQWTSGVGSGSSRGMDDERVLSDADPELLIPGAEYAQGPTNALNGPGGHHIVPQSIYENWSQEARSELRKQLIGPINNRYIVQTEPDGKLIRHLYDREHREYNRAVSELSNRFLRENNIDPKYMTGAQARDLRERVDSSSDPRIRDFNSQMRLLARITRVMKSLRGE